ncbi:MAG: hypothetical protein TREMPRED_002578 [Tremellales sp. Tagirdzhanova-0007]|nr:MAG: hypothetical protein TREMPRED_002578 [Tremellales sp. Tagirdzhanova-0007]
MDGKPLYEYARESKPLPRAIPTRKCTVSIDLIDFIPASRTLQDGGHEYHWPSELLSVEDKAVFRRLTELVSQAQQATPDVPEPLVPDLGAEQVSEVSPKGLRPPTFTVKMTVSSGTYVRSIVHEIGLALGCAAHVVKLTRTRQGEFVLHGNDKAYAHEEDQGTEAEESSPVRPSTSCIPWSVWERAIAERKATIEAEKAGREASSAAGDSAEEVDQQYGDEAIFVKRRTGELKEWENELLRRFVAVPVPVSGSHSFSNVAYG